MQSEPARVDRLTLTIARLMTQRACIDRAAELVAPYPGCILEVGLGKARTFDRLRHCFPEREIFALDKEVHCPAAARPQSHELILGDFEQTLPLLEQRIGASAAVIHADFGSDDAARDAALAAAICPRLNALARVGAVILSDRAMAHSRWTPLSLPAVAAPAPWPYFMWQVAAA